MTDLQLQRLEELYQIDTHPSREQKQALGEAVGMWVSSRFLMTVLHLISTPRDTRTVTVWFQNRRQLAKKNTSIVNATPQLMSRLPLGIVSHRNSSDASRAPSVVSSVSQSSVSDRKSPRPPSRHLKRDLWEYLPSSPPTSAPVSAATSAMPSPIAKRLSHIVVTGKENLRDGDRKRKPILEWACARAAKRQRREREDEDLDVDITDVEDGADFEDTLVDIAVPDVKGKRKEPPVTLPTSASLTAFVIPAEYNAKFAPDVVLGASLLLTFQHSK